MSQQFFGSRFRRTKGLAAACLVAMTCVRGVGTTSQETDGGPNQVLEWNQIFVDTLIVTGTPNSSSQRLGAIVHTAIFDAFNGIERRYTPMFAHNTAPRGASRRAAVIAAAYTTLAGLFPARQEALAEMYAASMASLSDDGGTVVNRATGALNGALKSLSCVLAWRATDGFNAPYPPFTGGPAIGQWRPTPPAFGAMSAQGLAFTLPFVLTNSAQFQPPPPRGCRVRRTPMTSMPSRRSAAAPARRAPTTRRRSRRSGKGTPACTGTRPRTRSRARTTSRCPARIGCSPCSTSRWRTRRSPRGPPSAPYGADPLEVTWRPVTAIPLADTDGNPSTEADPAWLPLINTPVASRVSSRASEPQRCGCDGAPRTLRRSAGLQVDDRAAKSHLYQHLGGPL